MQTPFATPHRSLQVQQLHEAPVAPSYYGAQPHAPVAVHPQTKSQQDSNSAGQQPHPPHLRSSSSTDGDMMSFMSSLPESKRLEKLKIDHLEYMAKMRFEQERLEQVRIDKCEDSAANSTLTEDVNALHNPLATHFARLAFLTHKRNPLRYSLLSSHRRRPTTRSRRRLPQRRRPTSERLPTRSGWRIR